MRFWATKTAARLRRGFGWMRDRGDGHGLFALWLAFMVLTAAAITSPGAINFLASGTGAVMRSLASKAADEVSVKDFGATGNGTTDDTIYVVAALAALPSSGGRLLFPAATYKFNLSTTRGGVVLVGAGSGNINTGLGGTKFIAADASKPILQFGDGATTTSRGNAVRDVILVGDGANVTGDGIYLFGARDMTIDNVAISAFGRDGIRIQCNTTSSSGIHIGRAAISGSKGANLRAEACAGSFTSNITVTDSHFNDAAVASGGRAIYLDSTTVNLVNTYLDLHDGVGIQMVKNFSGNPNIEADSVNFDNADGSTATSMDVSTVYASAARLSTVINGCFRFNGKVVYSDATVNVSVSRGCVFYQPWSVNPAVFNSLQLPISEVEAQAGGTIPTLSRSGNTPDTDADIILAHSGFKVSAADGANGFNNPLHLGTSALYKNQGGLLMWRKDANRPTAENNAQVLGWVSTAPTFGATVTMDLTLANVFLITIPNGSCATNFTINNPSGSGTGVSSHGNSMQIVCVINTCGGAYTGATTWSANWHLAGAWVNAANTNRRCAGFQQDPTGSPWYETWRSVADIAN